MPCSLRVSDTASWTGWELQRPVSNPQPNRASISVQRNSVSR